MANYWEPDDKTIINSDGWSLTVELARGPLKGIDQLYGRYLGLMGCSMVDMSQWMSKEDFILMGIRKGLRRPTEKFSDIINEALVMGMLEVAAFQAKCEKELKITEGE